MALNAVLTKGRSLRPVADLTEWERVEGVYVMVFDEFKQLYVGQSTNVRNRVRHHWTGRKSFDRLVWGTLYESILPVDELRALDTTRLYAARSLDSDALEARLERAADPHFALNRTAGGAFNPLGILLTGARARDHALTSIPSAPGEYWVARDVIRDHLVAARQDTTSPVPRLAGLDMSIRVEVDQDGRPHFWSNRDLVGAALRSGLVTAAEFEEFLTRLGETVVWPAEKPPRRLPLPEEQDGTAKRSDS
ncbi:GIY-YIG nuclease family protein [Curtobacterium poinsettiae]|uniref:GIY-YIG nuclease family protein n=1 Tax=Curtobacterium poinsettiae TaxID=159612 RepID=A0ABT3S154_9MICO|nr:GIY-YIG nuclease family protein [Curtobacterium flaccumfaciens]MBT1609705.1 GIY-YIG nuclease family protein [Curtobacterium flaccumfaciens pv. poinsettiae]MCX2848567.1 GIY-YIG nuclease family protein [Curtobacterium flaccumfaciens pv. poinsettiae]UXN19154.1 GIY-YIG nuclease family protein [Curtobacterium flaccumfaciens pv. poinsettiae]